MNIKNLLTPENMSTINNEQQPVFYSCTSCEGTGRVSVTEEGKIFSDYCGNCCGEGFIEYYGELSFQLPKQTDDTVLNEEDKKAINTYGKQVANNLVNDNLSIAEKELLIGMALQSFEDGLIFSKKINN